MRSPVSPADRLRDATALALLVGGAALFLYAFRGMEALAAGRFTVAPGEWATSQWERYRQLSLAGLALAAAGVATAVYSFWSRARRRDESSR